MYRITSRKRVVLTLIALLTLCLTLTPILVQAQQDACFGLKPDDCQLLVASNQPPSGALSSFTMDYQISFKGTGMPDGDTAFTVHGTGPFSISGDVSDITSQMSTGTNPNIQKLLDTLSKVTLGNTIDAEVMSKGQDQKFHVEFRVVNNTLYLNAGAMTQNKWQSVDLKMVAGAFAGMAGARPSTVAQNAQNPQMADAIKALLLTPNLIKAERGEDLTIDNQQVAVFVFHIDLPSLFNSASFVTMVKEAQAQNPNSKTKPLTDAEIQALGSQLATAFKGVQITFSRFVGVTDKLPHGGSIDITGTLNPADFKSLEALSSPMNPVARKASGSLSPSTASGPINLDFHAKITLSGIGQKIDVPVPAGAVPFNFGGSK